jgi:AraC-like DNA-binding protein
MPNENKFNKSANRVHALSEYRCRQAVQVLREQIVEIPHVKTWAEEAGVSRRWLCKSMKAVYGKPPKIILREVKYEKIVMLILEEGADATCYSVSVDAGFGSAKNGSRFLSSHYETTFTELKMDLLKEDHEIDFQWLNGRES